MIEDTHVPTGVEEPASAPVRRGALGAWWREGARSAFLLKPDWTGLQATPGIVACLVGVALLLGVLVERLYIDGPARFHWPSLELGWLPTVITAWVCWLAGPRGADAGAPRPAALFAMLAAQSLTVGVVLALVFMPILRGGSIAPLGTTAWTVLWLLAIGWLVAAQTMLVWRSSTQRQPLKVAACALLLAAIVGESALRSSSHWVALPTSASADERPPAFALTQELLEAQPRILAARLQAIAPQRPGVIDVFAITFAPYADEDVFKRESQLVADVMQQRFDAAGRTLQLVNHPDSIRDWPWATPLNLQRAIQRMAERMDRDEDVLFIHLTSHGARAASLAASLGPLQVDSLTPQMLKGWLDAAGIRHRVISVSACYSGSWIAPLAGPDTLVMTAADAEHTSYGCGRRSELTYFGRAMFDEQLRQTWSFEQAHAAAREVIAQREREAGKSDGFSNPQIDVGRAIRETLLRLAAQRAAASR